MENSIFKMEDFESNMTDEMDDVIFSNVTSMWTNNTTTDHPYTPVSTHQRMSVAVQVVITLNYLVGVIGNSAALLILCRRRRHRNRKHALMLRCLACNDLVALLGMLVQMYIRLHLPPHLVSGYWTCVARVMWRIFGLGSGCVAAVMAIERWLALTHPFLVVMPLTS